MTEKEVLEWARDIACEELFAASANYGMTKPKVGFERKHAETKERVQILEDMIQQETDASCCGCIYFEDEIEDAPCKKCKRLIRVDDYYYATK